MIEYLKCIRLSAIYNICEIIHVRKVGFLGQGHVNASLVRSLG